MSDSNRLTGPLGNDRDPTRTFSYATLDGILAQARARLLVLHTLTGVGLGIGAFGLFSLLGAWALGAAPSAPLRWAVLGVLAGTLLVAPVAGLMAAMRSRPASVVERIARSDPRLRSMLLSAVELRRLGPAPSGLSIALIEAQAAFATERARHIDLRKAVSTGPAEVSLGMGFAVLLIAGLFLRHGPPAVTRGFAALRHLPLATRPGRAAEEPITGDIELTFSYPAHTHLAQRTVAGTNGEIQAPKGTQVSLRTRADRAVQQAEIVVDGAAQALAVSGDRMLSGSFMVSRPGNYFFRFGPASHPIAEGPPIAIAIQADAPPQVSLEAPPEKLEVQPKEVVELRYQATDDFGLSEIRLVYRSPGAGKETSVPLRRLAEQPLRVDGTARFDLGPLNLMAGDQISYALEALDNDDVDGPKLGRSRPHVLEIFSPAEHHREALARARALWERLVGLLGDRLEEAAAPPAASANGTDVRAVQLCQDLEDEAHKLLTDRNQEKGIAIALRNVARGERRRASATSDEREANRDSSGRLWPARAEKPRQALADEVEGLERDVLYLEALLDQATTQDLSALLRELMQRRRELAEMLERYRKNPTLELKEQLLALFNQLKARSAQLASRMQELAKGVTNQPHLNLEEVPKGFASDLSRVEQALASGDADKALELLDQMGGQLDAMQDDLDRMRGGAKEENRELAHELKEFKDNLDEVQRSQTKIAGETEDVRREARKILERRSPAPQSMLDDLRAETQRAKAQLDQVPETAISRGLPGDDALLEAKERTADLDRALQSKDLDEALHSADQALRSVDTLQGQLERNSLLRSLTGRFAPGESSSPGPDAAQARAHLQQASTPLQAVRDKLQKLFPDEHGLLEPEQKEQLSRLQREQDRVQQRAQGLSQKLEQIGKEAPVFDPSAQESLRAAQGLMRDATQRLGQREPGQASEDQRGAIEQLDRLSKAMSRSGGGHGAGGVPNPFALGQSDGEGESDGAPGADREKVVVPGADQYQVPAQFRRDILDAMKQRAPKPYEDEVKHYYQEIVK